MNIFLNFSKDTFLTVLEGQRDNDLQRSLENAVRGAIEEAFESAIGHKLLKSNISGRRNFSTKDGPIGSPDFSVARILKEGGFYVNDFQFQLDAPKSERGGTASIVLGPDLDYSSQMTKYDNRVWPPKLQFKEMKHWNRYSFRLYSLRVAASHIAFSEKDTLVCKCQSQYLRPIRFGKASGSIMNWMCVLCGRQYLCSCAQGYLEKLCNRVGYDNSTYEELVKTASYRTGTCHLCRGSLSEIQYRSEMYGGPIYQLYFPYILQESSLHDLDLREGENRVRERLGLPRIGEGWLSEMMVIHTVRFLFPELTVEHQASPPWLGRQRFDGYIKEHKVAFEYNGEQHYYPVARFGGEGGLRQTKERDRRKIELAAQHGVEVVIFHCDEELTEALISKRVQEAITRQVKRYSAP